MILGEQWSSRLVLTHKYRATSCISSQLKRVRMDLTVCNIQVVIGWVKTGVTVLTHSFIFYINWHKYFINITMPILGGMTEILITSMHIYKKITVVLVCTVLVMYSQFENYHSISSSQAAKNNWYALYIFMVYVCVYMYIYIIQLYF